MLELDQVTLLTQLMRDVPLSAERLMQPPSPVHPSVQARWNAAGPTVLLPDPVPSERRLEDGLQQRRSVQNYRPVPLTLGQVHTLLIAAHALDLHHWPEESEAGASLQFIVAARCVAGLATGIYLYAPDQPGLIPVGSPTEEDPIQALVLQRVFASAPMVLVVVGNLAAAVGRHQSHGYRQLLVRAGAAAQQAALAGMGLRLASSIIAGLHPTDIRNMAGADGYTQVPLIAVTLGYPQ